MINYMCNEYFNVHLLKSKQGPNTQKRNAFHLPLSSNVCESDQRRKGNKLTAKLGFEPGSSTSLDLVTLEFFCAYEVLFYLSCISYNFGNDTRKRTSSGEGRSKLTTSL